MELDYSFSRIDIGDLGMLSQFLLSAGSSLNTFRYFQNRPLSIIENHLITCLLVIENQPVGYGHLDKDADTVWLGIAVSEGFKGKGLGKLIMNFLISAARDKRLSKVKLTVDENNTSAISLYESFGFVKLCNFKENSIMMELEI